MLIVDQAREAVTHICLHGDEYGGNGEGYFAKAAARYQENPNLGILVIEPRSSRLVRTGILPSFAALSRRELSARGAPEKAVFLIPGEAADVWQEARHLGVWLQDHPHARVQFLCNRFRSRYLRTVLDETLDPATAARVCVLPIPNRGFDENSWWQSRPGVREFMQEFLLLCYAKLHGENTETGPG